MRVEYRQFPLSFHKYAETSAVASFAAQRQGKFFEFVDKLYANLKDQDAKALEGFAKDIGMDVAQFQADVKDPELLRAVRMEAKAGGRVGVSGTPSMFLNGAKLEARDVPSMKTAIEKELAEVDTLIKAGDSVADARRKRILAAKGGVVFYDYVVQRKPIEVDLTPPKPAPKTPKKAAPVDKTVYQAEIFPGDPMKGPADALVTIVECTDFQ